MDNGNLGGKFIVANITGGSGIGNTQMATANVYVNNGTIIIESDSSTAYTINTIDGRQIVNGICDNKATEKVNQGIYLVKVANTTHKVCVLQ